MPSLEAQDTEAPAPSHILSMTPNERIAKIRERIMPLEQFSEEMRAEIAYVVAQDRPPQKWIYFGDADDPRPLAMAESRAWHEWYMQRGIDPAAIRERIPRSLRAQVIERDGYVCGLCGGVVEPSDVHLDHIVPVSHGGPTTMKNLQVAHSSCNIRKGARV